MAALAVNQLFARAEALFASGQFEEESLGPDQVQRLTGDHPAVFRLRALVEEKRGRYAAAIAAFAKAVQLAPPDPTPQ